MLLAALYLRLPEQTAWLIGRIWSLLVITCLLVLALWAAGRAGAAAGDGAWVVCAAGRCAKKALRFAAGTGTINNNVPKSKTRGLP